MKDRVFQLAVLLVLVIGISVGVSSISRGDDEIAPTDQTVQEQDINRWVPLKIKMTGAVLGRTPSLSLTAIGRVARTCAQKMRRVNALSAPSVTQGATRWP